MCVRVCVCLCMGPGKGIYYSTVSTVNVKDLIARKRICCCNGTYQSMLMESTHTYRNQNVYMSIRMDSMDYTKLSKHMHLKYITSVTIGTVMFN